MSVEEDSVAFLQNHIETSFSDLLSHFIITKIEWLDGDKPRPIAFLKDKESNKSNLICLFPPFIPNKKIK